MNPLYYSSFYFYFCVETILSLFLLFSIKHLFKEYFNNLKEIFPIDVLLTHPSPSCHRVPITLDVALVEVRPNHDLVSVSIQAIWSRLVCKNTLYVFFFFFSFDQYIAWAIGIKVKSLIRNENQASSST